MLKRHVSILIQTVHESDWGDDFIKTFIRDMKELKWYIRQFLFMQLKLNVLMLGLTFLMSKLPDQQYSLIPTWVFGCMILTVINVTFPLGFIIRYLYEWKPMIHEKYKDYNLRDKYEFLHSRFK